MANIRNEIDSRAQKIENITQNHLNFVKKQQDYE